MNKYALLLKTGESELRAIDNLNLPDGLLPIIELTRGRKSKSDSIGDLSKKIKKIESNFHDREIILDLTNDSNLSNIQIDNLFDPQNGYENWLSFLSEQASKNKFRRIIPSILVNTKDENLETNLQKQASSLSQNFKSIAYRCDIEDEGCIDDIHAIGKILNYCESHIIIDCGYIIPSDVNRCAERAAFLINQIHEIVPNAFFIMTSTSFPDKLPDEDNGFSIRLSEIDLYNNLVKRFDNISIIYGDYGSINPIRNDNIFLSRGWRPRIDIPLQNEIYYYRRRRDLMDYSTTYSFVAREAYEDSRFPKKMDSNWGINQIINAANGAAPGASPSFWISVRMNIYIEQQLRRLRLFKYT